MGGRGSSSGRGGGGGAGPGLTPATSVGDIGTTPVDLTGMPLMYGRDDPNIAPDVRDVLEEFEDRHWKNKIEYGRIVDVNGNVLQDAKGGKGSVSMSAFAHANGAAMTNNHPRQEGMLGGTFSDQDLRVFANYDKTLRATAKEGTYSISKLGNFDEAGFRGYVVNEYAAARKAYQSVLKGIKDNMFKAYNSKNTSAEALSAAERAYIDGQRRAFNGYLVDLHNRLLAGQSQFGYYYTLERRDN